MFESAHLARRLRVGALAITLAVLVTAASPTAVLAQGAGGTVFGAVGDAQGATLPGVTVTARHAESGVQRVAVTDHEGRYRLAGLPPGPYLIRAELTGFATTEVRGVEVNLGAELRHDLALALSALDEQVTVRAEAPVIEVTRADVSALVTQAQIDTLPIAGRSAVTLALLLPGTGNDTTRASRPGANVGSGGITTAATNYIVDGLNNMISMAGDAREDVPQSAIQEFKVHTAQAPAEFGGRSGGVINVVTKSGTNALRGEFFEFFRHRDLNTLNVYQQQRHDEFGEPKPDFRRDQYGAALGGPIIRNRAHFFGAIDRTRELEYFQVNTGRPDLYGAHEGTFKGGGFANLYFGKVDVQANSRQRVTFRASRQDSTRFCLSCGGTNAAFSSTDNEVPGFTFYGAHSWQVTDRVFAETALLYAESNQTNPPGSYTPPGYAPEVGSTRYVFPSFTWGSRPGTTFRNPYYQFRTAVSIAAGNHVWRIGGGAQVLPTHITTPANEVGTWTFGTDQYFNPADPAFDFAALVNPIQFQQSFPTFNIRLLSHTYELYVQDDWRVNNQLTLNLGLRYDLQRKVLNEHFSQDRYPRPLPYVNFGARGDFNNVAPRVGFAWSATGDGRTVVRGGYGLVHGNLQNAIARGEHDAFQQFSVNIRNPSYPDPYQGRDPYTFVSTAPPNIQIVADDVENPETHTASGGVSRELGARLALHVDAVYSRTVKYPVGVQVNTPDPATGVRPLPEWGNIQQVQKGDVDYTYRAVLLRLERRFADRYLYTASYTLSKQDAGFRSGTHYGTITDANNWDLDRGPTDNDRRHSFVLSGSVVLPFELTLGGVWTLRSSRPFSAQAGRDLNGDGTNNDFVPGTTRNQGNRGLDLGLVNAWRAANNLGPIAADQIDSDRFNRFDVRLSRGFSLSGGRRLDLIAQVFNVFGTDNLGGVGSGWTVNALSSSFGRLLEAQPRQQAELAAKFSF